MSAGTKLFLLLGCLAVIALEAPFTLASLTAGWRGPYSRPALAAVPPAAQPAHFQVPAVEPIPFSYGLSDPQPYGRTRIARR